MADTSNIVERYQKLVKGSKTKDVGSYINSDLDSSFRFRFTKQGLRLTGTPFRYKWLPTDGHFVKVVEVIPFLDEDAVQAYYADESTAAQISQMQQEAAANNSLFRKTALMRTICIQNRTAWQAFVNEIIDTFTKELNDRLKKEAVFKSNNS